MNMLVVTLIMLVMGGMVEGACESCRSVIGGDNIGRYQLVQEGDSRCLVAIVIVCSV